MVGLGVHPHVADKILAQTMPGIMGRYQHAEYEAERKAALDLWASHILKCTKMAEPAVQARAEATRAVRNEASSRRLKAIRAKQTPRTRQPTFQQVT